MADPTPTNDYETSYEVVVAAQKTALQNAKDCLESCLATAQAQYDSLTEVGPASTAKNTLNAVVVALQNQLILVNNNLSQYPTT